MKKIALVVLLATLVATVWLKFLSPSITTENSVVVLPDTPFKEAALDLQPNKKLPVDRPSKVQKKLLKLLKSESFVALDKAIESEAIKFDKGDISEPTFAIIISNIAQLDPALEQPLLNWIDHSESWAAYIVASKYFKAMSWQWRGGSYWSKVPEENRQKFKAYQDLAKAINNKAKQHNKRDVLWYSDRIGLANQDSSTDELVLINEALEKYPESIEIHHTAIYAQSAKWGGDESFRQQLIHNYGTILDKEQHDGGPTTYFYAAFDAADVKDYITAIREIRSAIKRNPNRLWYYSALAKYYYKTEQNALALSAINTTLKYRPYRIDDLLRRANILLKVGKPERAIKDLETVLSFSPIHKEANTLAFSAYAKLGKRELALAALEQAGYFTQYNAKELSRQGFFARYDLKDIELAKSYYDRALEVNSLSASAHYAYATLYGDQVDCQIVEHLYEYLGSCDSSESHDPHWCKPRYKNWAISSVNHLKGHKQCPEIEDYEFESLF